MGWWGGLIRKAPAPLACSLAQTHSGLLIQMTALDGADRRATGDLIKTNKQSASGSPVDAAVGDLRGGEEEWRKERRKEEEEKKEKMSAGFQVAGEEDA